MRSAYLAALLQPMLRRALRGLRLLKPGHGPALAPLPPPAATKLETLWAEHLGQPAPLSRVVQRAMAGNWTRPGAQTEDTAQDRLTAHFRDRGWVMRDVWVGNPYDAIAMNDGRTLWLEAKGTETNGAAVIVPRREVQWARDHPGDCVLAILSDAVFQPDGDVEPASGTFRVFTWNPDSGTLSVNAGLRPPRSRGESPPSTAVMSAVEGG